MIVADQVGHPPILYPKPKSMIDAVIIGAENPKTT
jgi:hypothetical protein